jgi:hypothetical protein
MLFSFLTWTSQSQTAKAWHDRNAKVENFTAAKAPFRGLGVGEKRATDKYFAKKYINLKHKVLQYR